MRPSAEGPAERDTHSVILAVEPLHRYILAIDPGDVVSGLVLFDRATDAPVPGKARKNAPNGAILKILDQQSVADTLLIYESYEPRGQPLYKQLIDTAFWSGRFIERWVGRGGRWSRLSREAIKHAICGRTNVADPNVIAALVDRYGGRKAAVGLKKAPGPLYGVQKHAWQALALAVAWADGKRPPRPKLEPAGSAAGAQPGVAAKTTTRA